MDQEEFPYYYHVPEDRANPYDLPRHRTLYNIFTLFLAALILLFTVGYIPRFINWRALEKEAGLINPLLVKVITAKPDREPIRLTLPSTTDAINVTPIWARTNGYIKEFYSDIGDHVEKGQLMAEISTPEIESELKKAEEDLDNALARLEIAKITTARWNDLYETDSESVSPQDVEERAYSYQAELAAFNSALANAERIEKILNFNKIYAPFPGTITERNIDIGTLITAGSEGNLQQMYQIAKTDIIRVFAGVPQAYYRLIKIGGEADIMIKEFPELVFKGIIARTAKALDPIARTLLTEIHVDNSSGLLITGLYADVAFVLMPDTNYFIVPTTSLIIREGRPHVAVVDKDNRVHLNLVNLGRDYGKTIEITSGIHANDKVITNPSLKIEDGVKVEIAGS